MDNKPTKLYRYEDHVYSTCEIDPGGGEHYSLTSPRIECYEYNIIKETPQGYWFVYGNFSDLHSNKRWVNKSAKKRYCYPSKEEALNSFIRRKERQIGILTNQLYRAKDALEQAKYINIE